MLLKISEKSHAIYKDRAKDYNHQRIMFLGYWKFWSMNFGIIFYRFWYVNEILERFWLRTSKKLWSSEYFYAHSICIKLRISVKPDLAWWLEKKVIASSAASVKTIFLYSSIFLFLDWHQFYFLDWTFTFWTLNCNNYNYIFILLIICKW